MNKSKFLGIIIEEHLNWATHIFHLCKIIVHSLKVTIFYSGLYIENSIPFINIVAPTILHVIKSTLLATYVLNNALYKYLSNYTINSLK